jgi:hypothetical protein
MEPQTASGPTLLCDFCNEPVADVRSYDAAPLSMKFGETVVYICDSKWAACTICSQMIDENRWDELTGRSYELWLKTENGGGVDPGFGRSQFIKTHLTQLHQLFREARGRTA